MSYSGVSKIRSAEKRDWLLRIGRTYINMNYLKNKIDNVEASEYCDMEIEEPSEIILDITEKHFYAAIEEDPEATFDYIQRESVSSCILFSRMCRFLPGKAIEYICTRVFLKRDVSDTFVQTFYDGFFSFFLTRPYTWYSLHLLIRASKAHPMYFRNTVKHLLKNYFIRSCVLVDYVSRISEEECTELMGDVMEMDLTAEEFDHVTPVIHLIFKKCPKTERTLQYMLTKVEMCSQTPAVHKMAFGRLCYYFVQNIEGRYIVRNNLRHIFARLRTTYKNLCLTTLDNHVRELRELQDNIVEEGPWIIVPRYDWPRGGL